jgi:hypothetical protein
MFSGIGLNGFRLDGFVTTAAGVTPPGENCAACLISAAVAFEKLLGSFDVTPDFKPS